MKKDTKSGGNFRRGWTGVGTVPIYRFCNLGGGPVVCPIALSENAVDIGIVTNMRHPANVTPRLAELTDFFFYVLLVFSDAITHPSKLRFNALAQTCKIYLLEDQSNLGGS